MARPAVGGRGGPTRRQFLGAAVAALAGCAGGTGGGPRSTTSEALGNGADVGPYPEWMVSREGAGLFLFTYYPQFGWLLEELPAESLREALAAQVGGSGDSQPSGVLDPRNVEEYFYGFTDADGLAYHLTWGAFDPATVRERLRSDRGYEPLDRSVGAFDLLRKGTTVVGVADGLLIDVAVASADPVAAFEAVHRSATGEAPSYAGTDRDYALLTDALGEGHRIESRPNAAEELGAAAYGRQYVYDSAEFSRVQAVLVGDGLTAAGVRSAVETDSGLYDALGVGIESVAVEDRVATVTYEPVPTSKVWGGRYGGFVDVYST